MPGKPKGSPKTGGRRAGTPNRVTTAAALALIEAEKEVAAKLSDAVVRQLSPIDVMLRTMRLAVKAGHGPLALASAQAVAPYLYPKLSNVEMQTTTRRSLKDFSTDELMAILPPKERERFGRSGTSYVDVIEADANDEDPEGSDPA